MSFVILSYITIILFVKKINMYFFISSIILSHITSGSAACKLQVVAWYFLSSSTSLLFFFFNQNYLNLNTCYSLDFFFHRFHSCNSLFKFFRKSLGVFVAIWFLWNLWKKFKNKLSKLIHSKAFLPPEWHFMVIFQ